MASSRAMPERFAAPRAPLHLSGAPPELLALSARLWERGGEGSVPFRLRVVPGSAPPELPERDLRWSVEGTLVTGAIAGHLSVMVDAARGWLEGRVTRELLAREPALVARALLEAPVAALLTFRLAAIHAGAVAGRRGAVVLRGAPGAGKSTLTAACHRAGLLVLSDESLLADPREPETLLCAVRDLTLRPDSPALAGLGTSPAFSGGEEKRRVDLFAKARPSERVARRRATLLLGAREPGPARLAPLPAERFLRLFSLGEVPQEGLGAGATKVAAAWAGHETYLLEGHADLLGAAALVRSLTD